MDKPNLEKIKVKNSQLQIMLARYYKIITLGVVILLFVSSYYFIFEPQYIQLSQGGEYNLQTLKIELAEKQKYFQDLKALINNYKKIDEQDLEKLEKLLPYEKDIAGLFVQMQNLAQSNNLLISDLSINDAASDTLSPNLANVKKLNISLNLIGATDDSYEEVKKFLKSLEENLRLFDVVGVYFAPKSPTYSLNILTYYLAE